MRNYNASGQLENGVSEFRNFVPATTGDGGTLTAEGQRVLLLFIALHLSTTSPLAELISVDSGS